MAGRYCRALQYLTKLNSQIILQIHNKNLICSLLGPSLYNFLHVIVIPKFLKLFKTQQKINKQTHNTIKVISSETSFRLAGEWMFATSEFIPVILY